MSKENTGNCNTGDYNTGNCNTGNWNTGDLNTTKPATVRLFNHDSGWEFFGEKHLRLQSILRKYSQSPAVWVSEKDVTVQEKEVNFTYKTTGGYLKTFTNKYNGEPVSDEDREFLESVPNFCPKILEECTGIVLDRKRTIELDGKKIEISEESFQAFKRQFAK